MHKTIFGDFTEMWITCFPPHISQSVWCVCVGGAGHAVKGLYRVHQFSKVELFAVTEEGRGGGGVLDEMVSLQEEICAELGLHYR